MDFLTLKPETFGLDISDLSMKIVKLKKKREGLALASFGEEKIKPEIIENGEIRDQGALTEAIKKFLPKVKGEKLKTKYVAVSLPEEKAFLQVIQMPIMPKEDLKSAVIYEAENYVPLPIEEVYLDSQIINHDSGKLDHFDVLIAALPRKTIDPYLTCLKKSGLIPKILEIESSAIARALIKNEVSSFPLLLIDLGATKTGFAIFSGYSLRFTFSIPVSSLKFTEAISKNLKINLEEAEKLKLKYGIQRKDSDKAKEIFDSLVPALTDLTEQIKKYLNYYQTHTSHEHLPSNGKGVKKVIISGGGANLKGFSEFLSSELKIPVELGNPWTNILPKPLREVPELPYQDSLRYTTALGLALRGVNDQ